mgnify:CR=1 FL=1
MMILGAGFGLGVALVVTPAVRRSWRPASTIAGLVAGGVVGCCSRCGWWAFVGCFNDRAVLDRWVTDVTSRAAVGGRGAGGYPGAGRRNGADLRPGYRATKSMAPRPRITSRRSTPNCASMRSATARPRRSGTVGCRRCSRHWTLCGRAVRPGPPARTARTVCTPRPMNRN